MATRMTAKQVIEHYGLKPLPAEGGLFARTYLADDVYAGSGLPSRYAGVDHAHGSAIIMLLTDDAAGFSALHRLATDEIYHFYLGDPIEMLNLRPDGTSRIILLGQDVIAGQRVQFSVPAGVWQGSRLLPGGTWALFGTTMAPAFVATDFEAARRDELLTRYPHEHERIRALTRTTNERFMPPGSEA